MVAPGAAGGWLGFLPPGVPGMVVVVVVGSGVVPPAEPAERPSCGERE